MARYLLDTNTCIAVMRNYPKAVQRMAAVPPGECVISTITAYELYTGVEKCSYPLLLPLALGIMHFYGRASLTGWADGTMPAR